MINYLSKESVLEINRQVTSPYGQAHVVLSEASLDHLLGKVEHYGENIQDPKEKLLKKAALLLYHAAFDFHIFADGNKRTAFSSAQAFLSINGFRIAIKKGEEAKTEAMIKETAQGRQSTSAVYKWLKSTALEL